MKVSLSIKRVFGVALVLKLICAVASYVLRDPWWFGLYLPILVMVVYIVIGLRWRGDDVSEEKFADSCYYLGFIFTIASIITSLLDLKDIADRLGDIAVRFGAAMISTVLGMSVRVYLVNFRQDLNDALVGVEQSVVENANAFRTQLQLATEQAKQFQEAVAEASKQSFARVDLAIQGAVAKYSTDFSKLFEEIAGSNNKLAKESSEQLREAYSQLASSVALSSGAHQKALIDLQAALFEFSRAMTMRLNSITFPDDYFIQTLEPPLTTLSRQLEKLGKDVTESAASVRGSHIKLNGAMTRLSANAERTADAFESTTQIVETQQKLGNVMEEQYGAIGLFASSISELNSSVGALLEEIRAQHGSIKDISVSQRDLVASDSPFQRQAASMLVIGNELRQLGGRIERLISSATTQGGPGETVPATRSLSAPDGGNPGRPSGLPGSDTAASA